ncbi:expressed protein [Echinococcus multilocularis]|uniref:Expressed protein n=1 Tax=Echinococcus multilocularis TaxID=6211 RepID=A0A068Y152_ECHMU|nr:expressed protein [Echinococcus multilocularis]
MAVLVSFLVHSHHRLNTSILGSAPPHISAVNGGRLQWSSAHTAGFSVESSLRFFGTSL